MDPRYPMPPELHHWMQDIERQIRDLGTAPSLTRSSISDDDGNLRVRFGLLDDDGNYGMEIFDLDGGTRLRVDGRGMTAPYLPGIPRNPAEFITTTSPTFVTVWQSVFPVASHQGIGGRVGWGADPGTTGELRLKLGSNTTDAASLAAGTTGEQIFQWLHEATLGSGPQTVEIQARRTGGANGINIYSPTLEMRGPDGATSGGLL
jgi:hypothetical protein